METGEPTVELLKEYKEQLMAAAAARDKVDSAPRCTGKTGFVPIRPTALGLAVGRLRDHETPEVSEKAKALVARWVASAPARKRQESPLKSTQISQKEPATVRIQCDQEAFDQKDLSLRTAIEHGEGADIGIRSLRYPRKPSRSKQSNPSSTQPKTSFTQPKTSSTQPKTSSTQPKISSAAPTKPPTPPTRTFETDGLGDASALHEVPLRALTIELFYDALAAGAGDIPPRSLLPKAMSVEDVIYFDTAASLDDHDESAHIEASARTAHTDAYVRTAHSAFIALSSASDISTMRSDLLKEDITAEDFVDYILGEEEQVV
ncbi:hypothetical protein EV715DRAFT_272737 [Schizophyllum commune]